jgi:hypothetical protein
MVVACTATSYALVSTASIVVASIAASSAKASAISASSYSAAYAAFYSVSNSSVAWTEARSGSSGKTPQAM